MIIRALLLTSVFLGSTIFSSLKAAESKQDSNEETTQQSIKSTVLGMNVSGNKELPNVLYIIPWKKTTHKIKPPAVSRLVQEVYQPVDPDVFAKQVKFYYEQATPIEP